MRNAIGADSEIGNLRTVLVHRPGAELNRITPRTRDRLLLDSLPWVSRAQQEHDTFTEALAARGVEVLYVAPMLEEVLELTPARDEAIGTVLQDGLLGDELRCYLRGHLEGLEPEALARVLITGLAADELRSGHGLVYQLLGQHEFVIEPLPNLMFTRDSSTWIGDRVAIASLGRPRRRESDLIAVIYAHHPRFAGLKRLYQPGLEPLDGADLLLLGPGVLAVGVGARTAVAGLERLAHQVLDAGLAHTVLAVPVSRDGRPGQLDTLCTVVDSGTALMSPALAFTLTAHMITSGPDGLRVSHSRPFVEAAALALGIERLKIIETGLEPLDGPCGQWDDGGNALAIGGGTVLSHERTVETNARLQAAGLEVVVVPSSELDSCRGGPRALCCPVSRDPQAAPAVSPEPAADMAAATAQQSGAELAAPGVWRPDLLAAAGY